MTGLALWVRHVVKDGHEDAFDALAARTVAAIAENEPGTLVYAVHTLADQPSVRVFYELYRDRAAFEAHEAYPHTRSFLEERPAHVESVEVDVLTVAAAHARPVLHGDVAASS
ncbi:putative quinol monooxygenase [Actinotalea sp.]|uniref:putative quinol monooxygenase n=1 Tax=Actinotalea sp. TaxID=1872145 RepID=UPI0035674A4B